MDILNSTGQAESSGRGLALMVQSILRSGAEEVGITKDEYDRTPLLWPSETGPTTKVVELILASGADEVDQVGKGR